MPQPLRNPSANGAEPPTSFKEAAPDWRQIDQQFFAGYAPSHDKSAVESVFPDRKPRAGRSPRVHNLGIRPRSGRYPLEKIQDQRIEPVAH
jgi:hypothetical protein